MSQTPEMREAIALRKWDAMRDVVSITLTRRPDDEDMRVLNVAVHAFVKALTAPSPVVEGHCSSGGRVPAAPDGATDKPNDAGWFAYRGWWISYDPPPIPVRSCDWQFWHDDFDGAPDANDSRHGHAPSLEDAKSQIDDCEDDR